MGDQPDTGFEEGISGLGDTSGDGFDDFVSPVGNLRRDRVFCARAILEEPALLKPMSTPVGEI